MVGEGRNKMNPASSSLTPTTLACCHCPSEHSETDAEVCMWLSECQWKANHHFLPAHSVAQAACGWLSLPQGCSTASCHHQGHQSYLTFRATSSLQGSWALCEQIQHNDSDGAWICCQSSLGKRGNDALSLGILQGPCKHEQSGQRHLGLFSLSPAAIYKTVILLTLTNKTI